MSWETDVFRKFPLLLENQSPGKEICIIYFSFYKVIIEFFLVRWGVLKSIGSDPFGLFWRAAQRVSQDPVYP